MDNNHFMTQEDIDKVVSIFKNCNSMEEGETRWYPLAEDVEDNLWAIVLGKGFDEEYPEDVLAKVAFCPKRSMMHDYDIDWTMPTINDYGEVWDAEITADPMYVTWLAEQWAEMIKNDIVIFEYEEDEEDDEEEDE